MNDTPASVDIREAETPIPQDDSLLQAIALGYERGVDNAPKVLATGKGAIAEQILSIAYAQGIKVRQDADLLEILSTLEVDSVIPLEAFAAVAEILSYVYAANASLKQREARMMHKG